MESDKFQIEIADRAHLALGYEWIVKEPDRAQQTCRPIDPLPPKRRWLRKALEDARAGRLLALILVDSREPHTPIGRSVAFGFNPRNRSIEFGYYLPEMNRGRGLGRILADRAIDFLFSDRSMALNKIYATTSENNIPSIRLLEVSGFHIDGVHREGQLPRSSTVGC